VPRPTDPDLRIDRVPFHERLLVPPGWWGLGFLFCASIVLAVGWYLGWGAGLLAGAVPFALLGAVFLAYGHAPITVRDNWLTAGRARIELRWVGAVRALTPEETRLRRGRDADPRAYLLLRPYLPVAVEITLADRADPTPYWLVSTRRPHRLAARLAEDLVTNGPDRAEPGTVRSSG